MLLVVAVGGMLIGCQGTQTHAVEGSVIGGLLGAGAGYAIGKQSGHGGAGAGIGAAVGALGGGLIGGQMEKKGAEQNTAGSTAASSNQMAMQQIVDLSKQGVNDDVIIDRIRLSNSRYSLTASDLDYLKQQGVSQRVIDAMQGM
jgi:uncharacterized protein YcfJ